MKILIIGNGKVGFALAKQLSGEDHDLVLIDQNVEALRQADSTLDVLCMEGNGASINVQLEAGVREADLAIAVTGYDELNIMCCLIAKKLGAQHTVARIRNPEYFDESNLLKREVGLDMIINPEYAAAQEIGRILRVPSAFSVESFARGRVEMIGLYVKESDGLAGTSLQDFNRHRSGTVLVCAAIRRGELIIPDGRYTFQVGDRIYVIGGQKELDHFYRELNLPSRPVRSISVVGGSRVATYLGWAMDKLGVRMKLVEAEYNLDRSKILFCISQPGRMKVCQGKIFRFFLLLRGL